MWCKVRLSSPLRRMFLSHCHARSARRRQQQPRVMLEHSLNHMCKQVVGWGERGASVVPWHAFLGQQQFAARTVAAHTDVCRGESLGESSSILRFLHFVSSSKRQGRCGYSTANLLPWAACLTTRAYEHALTAPGLCVRLPCASLLACFGADLRRFFSRRRGASGLSNPAKPKNDSRSSRGKQQRTRMMIWSGWEDIRQLPADLIFRNVGVHSKTCQRPE